MSAGYTNEIGESFRSLVPLNLVRLSYLIAGAYCVADTCDKTYKASQVSVKGCILFCYFFILLFTRLIVVVVI